MNRIATHALRPRRLLRMESLEVRDVPAQVAFAAGNLTITATEGDTITVSRSAINYGGIVVSDSSGTIFSTSSTLQIPRNVTVNMGNVNSATLNISSTTEVLGNLAIKGAKSSSTVSVSSSRVNGHLSYSAAATTATDNFTWVGTVFGNMNVNLGNGTNTATLRGTVHQSCNVLAGSGSDNVYTGGTSSTDPFRVLGNGQFSLGNGSNTLQGNAGGLRVDGDFRYTGGTGFDALDYNSSQTRLSVGGHLNYSAGSGGMSWITYSLDVAGNYALKASAGNDSVDFRDDTSIGGGVSIGTGDGSSYVILATNLDFFRVGKSFSFTGGKDTDNLTIQNAEIGGNVSINVAEASTGFSQAVYLGEAAGFGLVRVGGNVSLNGGKADESFYVYRALIGGGLTVRTLGGSDSLRVDDSSIGGPSAVWLGSGNDLCRFDTNNVLTTSTRFAGTVKLNGGDGDDTFNFASGSGQSVTFGGKVSVSGGIGTDTLLNNPSNAYFVLGNTENCENGSF